jgi:1,4-dihydroxy-2-naphthoate octaprenyltransferase
MALVILQIIRAPFLTLTLAVLFVIFSATNTHNYAFLVILSALLAHISVNALNEYFDFKSGLDLITQKTPFSGGSGVLPNNPQFAPWALWIGFLSLFIITIIGIFLVVIYGINLLIIGVLGVLIIIFYTSVLNKFIFSSLISAGLGFALMVLGSGLVLEGFINTKIIIISIIIFAIVNNLLLLNQFPDREADKQVGRKNIVIRYNDKAKYFYLGFAILAIFTVIYATYDQILPTISIVTILPLGAYFYIYWQKVNTHTLGLNVIIANITPIILGVSVWIS